MNIDQAAAIANPNIRAHNTMLAYRSRMAALKGELRALIAPDVTLDADGAGHLDDDSARTATAWLLRHLDEGDAWELIGETNFDLTKQLAKVLDGDDAALMVSAMMGGAIDYARSAYIDDVVEAVAAERAEYDHGALDQRIHERKAL